MTESARHTNFCNNVRAYHNKREEEQFYDFTIRDKDGVEVLFIYLFYLFIIFPQ